MSEDTRNAIVRRGSGAIQKIGPASEGILTEMVSTALVLARSTARQIQTAQFKIGKYELCEPDYRQIQSWAKQLEIDPEIVIARLEGARFSLTVQPFHFSVSDGRMVHLVWDFASLPIFRFELIEGLSIEKIGFTGNVDETTAVALRLASLRALTVLDCANIQLTELELSQVPRLTEIECLGNQLTELDLSQVPELTKLSCGCNRLAELDLSRVPRLAKLYCYINQLTELDLSQVPELTDLWCGCNDLAELDLSQVPQLTDLECSSNQLAELALSQLPELTWLHCEKNQLSELDLSQVPLLTKLWCQENKITHLDIRKNTKLTELGSDHFVQLDKLATQNPMKPA